MFSSCRPELCHDCVSPAGGSMCSHFLLAGDQEVYQHSVRFPFPSPCDTSSQVVLTNAQQSWWLGFIQHCWRLFMCASWWQLTWSGKVTTSAATNMSLTNINIDHHHHNHCLVLTQCCQVPLHWWNITHICFEHFDVIPTVQMFMFWILMLVCRCKDQQCPHGPVVKHFLMEAGGIWNDVLVLLNMECRSNPLSTYTHKTSSGDIPSMLSYSVVRPWPSSRHIYPLDLIFLEEVNSIFVHIQALSYTM